MITDRNITAAEAAQLFGIPRRRVSDWLYEGRLRPAGYVRGRGRAGQEPLVRLSDIVEILADRHAAT